MKIIKTSLVLIIVSFSCQSPIRDDFSDDNYEEFQEIKKIIKHYNVTDKLIDDDNLLLVFNQFSDSLADKWNVDASRIVINNYQLTVPEIELIENLQYQYGMITLKKNIPEHIHRSFRKQFTCSSPEYIKKYPRERSYTIPYFELTPQLMIEIVLLKEG